MTVTGEKGLGHYLKIFLQICFYAGIAILILLPFGLSLLGLNLNASAVIIYPNGIVLLVMAHKFIELFDSLKNNNPFCDDNVRILKDTSKVSLIEAILWLIDLLLEVILVGETDVVTILTLIFLCVLFIGVSIAVYTLSELFKEAVEYKKENELSI